VGLDPSRPLSVVLGEEVPDGLKAALAASKFHRGLCLMPSTPRGGVRQDYRYCRLSFHRLQGWLAIVGGMGC
jgi:hypothetical protein